MGRVISISGLRLPSPTKSCVFGISTDDWKGIFHVPPPASDASRTCLGVIFLYAPARSRSGAAPEKTGYNPLPHARSDSGGQGICLDLLSETGSSFAGRRGCQTG